jgi:hypothetical protein
MRRFVTLLCACFLLLSVATALGQSAEAGIPKILVTGFDSYKSAGLDEAVRVWLRGSPLEGTQEAAAQETVLHATQTAYGPYRGFDLASVRQVSPSTRIVYLTIDYEKGPLFAKFVMFHAEPGWIVTSLLFNTNDTAVLPLQ